MTESEFERIFQDNWHEVFRFMRRRTSVLDDAEDATLEAFFRLWHNRDRVDERKANAWLKKVARNCLVSHHRALSAEKRPEEVELFDWIEKPSTQDLLRDYMIKEDMDRVFGVMNNSMTEQQELVIHMSFGMGSGGKRIGDTLNISRGAAEQCRKRALATLRDYLEDWDGLFSST